ncbi:MAG TPA: metallophosphoesterase [Myxococcales bacterium]|nr:metallophosphoesterase [Myxococcales bacterium]
MPIWARIAVFLVFFLAIPGAWHYFLYRRLVRAVTEDARLRRAGRWTAIALFALMIGGPLSLFFRNPVTEALGAGGWAWFGVAWYLFMSTALLWLLAWLGSRAARIARRAEAPAAAVDASRRAFLSRAVAGGAVAATSGLAGYGFFRAYAAPEITELSVKLARLPRALDGFTIVQVSDIHVGPTIGRRFLDDMVARVNALQPDLVAITGDLVDGPLELLSPAVAALGNLRARAGMAFITGNHEYYSGDAEWCAALEKMGIQVLRNRRIPVGDPAGSGGASFDLVGVDDWSGPDGRRYDLEGALKDRDPERAAVLLAHQPRNFEQAADLGMGLQLSGHTHGGQMFPFNFMVGLTTPYIAGHYLRKDAHLYVSRGTGYWGPPFRVGSPPEIVKVVLQAS